MGGGGIDWGAIVLDPRNNVELPPLLKNDVFQKNYFK